MESMPPAGRNITSRIWRAMQAGEPAARVKFGLELSRRYYRARALTDCGQDRNLRSPRSFGVIEALAFGKDEVYDGRADFNSLGVRGRLPLHPCGKFNQFDIVLGTNFAHQVPGRSEERRV